MHTRVSLVLALCLVPSACSRTRDDAAPPVAARTGDPEPVAQREPAAPAENAEAEPAPPEPEPPAAEPAVPAPPPKADSIDFAFVGDVIFGRYRAAGFDEIPEDGYEVFAEVADQLAADVLVGNLETPLVRDFPMQSPIGSKFRFGASPEHAKHLVTAGFTAVSLANNHWYDLRLKGVEQTPEILQELGVVPLGAATREPEVFRVEPVEKNGWSIGFLAITCRSNAPQREDAPTLPFLATRDIPATIGPVLEAARDQYDALVVQIHWGDEYEDGPNINQKRAAHAMIDAGADMVIGHHPHVLQGAEAYGKGLIVYSMGNFLFENTNDPPRLTGVLHVELGADGCRKSVRFKPAYVKRMPHQHPAPATGYMGRLVKARVRLVNKRFGSVWADDGDDLVLEDAACDAGPS